MQEQKKIGILGFGVVGKSALNFLSYSYEGRDDKKSNIKISVFDQRDLSVDEIAQINRHGGVYFQDKNNISKFFEENDYIIVSPGVDLNPFQQYSHKFIFELDLFSSVFKNKTIAITGTLGKTTVTNMIYKIVSSFWKDESLQNYKVGLGGNIGYGMLDLALKAGQLDLAVLELSSFQLELNKSFAPYIALWTNFFPNHLDRHKTLKEYFDAKWKIFANQTEEQFSLIPVWLLYSYLNLEEKLLSLKSKIYFVSARPLSEDEMVKLSKLNKDVFFIENNGLFLGRFVTNEGFIRKKIADLSNLPNFSFLENWILIMAAFYLLNHNLDFLKDSNWQSKLIEMKFNPSVDAYRLEHFAHYNDIDFYDDSKSTVTQATKAALEKLMGNNRPVILILGGLDKGVDRTKFFEELKLISKNRLKAVFCLSKQDSGFLDFKKFSSLQDLIKAIAEIAQPGDQVLFSPAGTSFDFFKNYKHRGDQFKEVVNEYIRKGEFIKT